MQTSNLSNVSPLGSQKSENEDTNKPNVHNQNQDLSDLWESDLKPKILNKYKFNRRNLS